MKTITTPQGKIIVDESAKIKPNTNTFIQGFNGDWFYNSVYKNIARIGDITSFDFKIIATINYSIDKDIPMVIVEDSYNMEKDWGNLILLKIVCESTHINNAYYKEKTRLEIKYAEQQTGFYSLDDVHKAIDLARKEPKIMIGDIIQLLKQECVELEMEEVYFHGSGYYKKDELSTKEQNMYSFMKEIVIKTTRVDGQLMAYLKQ